MKITRSHPISFVFLGDTPEWSWLMAGYARLNSDAIACCFSKEMANSNWTVALDLGLTVLWNSLPSDLRHVAPSPLVTNSPILNSRDSDLPTSLFLKKLQTHVFHCSFPPYLYSPRLSQEWFLLYWPSFVFSSRTHFAIIQPHFIHVNFYFIWHVCLWISTY